MTQKPTVPAQASTSTSPNVACGTSLFLQRTASQSLFKRLLATDAVGI
jgi:hypothetical protein